jgi:signal peptidase II
MKKIIPLSLTALVILLDQITKAFIVRNWPAFPRQIHDVFGNDFLCIYHVRNKVIAFSLGDSLPEPLRPIVFIIFPVAVLGFLLFCFFKTDDFTAAQRWAVAGIIGGGAGNILDRILRPDGVVDFISVKFYGFLGFERWPTFNVADSAVVVCVLLWLVTMIIPAKQKDGGSDEQKN